MLLLQLSGLVVNSVAIILNGTDVLPVTVTGGGRGGGSHNSSQVHFCPVDSAGITGQPLHSSKEIKPLLENLHLFQQPIILRLLEKELWIMRSYQMLKFRSIISI